MKQVWKRRTMPNTLSPRLHLPELHRTTTLHDFIHQRKSASALSTESEGRRDLPSDIKPRRGPLLLQSETGDCRGPTRAWVSFGSARPSPVQTTLNQTSVTSDSRSVDPTATAYIHQQPDTRADDEKRQLPPALARAHLSSSSHSSQAQQAENGPSPPPASPSRPDTAEGRPRPSGLLEGLDQGSVASATKARQGWVSSPSFRASELAQGQ